MAKPIRRDIDLGIMRFERGDEARLQRAILQISTYKHFAGLTSYAQVFWVGGHESRNQPRARCTKTP